MDMDIDTTAPATTRTKPTSSATTTTPTVLTRLCDTQAESFYIYLTVAVQDLFGSAMGGGINIDILGFWTTASQDPYNRLLLLPPTSNIPASSSTEGKDITKVTVTPTYSPTTAASSVLRCHSLDVNQLWNSLTLFNTLVDDFEARFEVRYVASTLMGLQANSRQLKWPA
ncbi:hypothetical protein KI688_003119 [Linnemannia hyalina]|uniref:Uncharacterized protein n=1 Tax=Linnemannia hyalina TaxID=64524 RepID=A0A9P7XRE6_9FUNG|nr:hypothetical protein KI688_003119 [Linnemannia hyalina]